MVNRQRSSAPRRAVHGVLLLDKPSGLSSNRALQQVKRLYRAAKAGHTGSLDPLATGMLPICFGEATKLTQFMLADDKRYRVTARLGEATTTGDAEGEVIATTPVPDFGSAELERVLGRFRGEIEQVPPMYSALKHEGRRLYDLARSGVEVDRPPRTVTIHSLTLVGCDEAGLELDVHCSKGTYIRTLVEDIAVALGTVAHVSVLRRGSVGIFDATAMVALATLEARADEGLDSLDALLLPVDSGIAHWPRLMVDPGAASCLVSGQRVSATSAAPEGLVRLYTAPDGFLGVGEVLPCGEVVPKRMFPALGVCSRSADGGRIRRFLAGTD
jgi:tRNA pseudouridine55 synthase